jgi:hypothetical protein
LQLANFRKIGLAPESIDWVDIGLGTVPPGLDEPEGVRRVLYLIFLGQSARVRNVLTEKFVSWLSRGLGLDAIVAKQNAAAREFLGDYRALLSRLADDLTADN